MYVILPEFGGDRRTSRTHLVAREASYVRCRLLSCSSNENGWSASH